MRKILETLKSVGNATGFGAIRKIRIEGNNATGTPLVSE
jgi:hypothetical protein